MRVAVAAMVVLLAGCGMVKIESGCTYKREVTSSYQCEPGGSLEQWRVAPGEPQ